MSEPPKSQSGGASAATAAATRSRFFGWLAWLMLGFGPGLWAVDQWVGWLDREEGSDEAYYVPDERLGWTPRPFFERPEFQTRLDRFGMRNPDFGAREPGEVRILGLGSSRFYGAASVQQPDVWNYALQKNLEDAGAGPVRVLNGAVMAYSGIQCCWRAIELMDREQDGVAIAPDLILVTISPNAQLMLDPRRTQRWQRVGESLVPRDVIEGWPELLWPARVGIHRWLMRSHLYVRKRAQFSVGDEGGLDDKIQRWSYSRSEQPEELAELVELTFDEYEALARAAADRNIELRVVVLPESFQDGERRWARYLRDFAGRGAPPVGTPRLEGVQLLLERCADLGLTAWDFSDEVTQMGTAPKQYYAADAVHWSAAGHSLIAAGIARRLKSEGLLERLRSRPSPND